MDSKNIGYLVKFVEPERVESFLDGEIYFSPLKHFVDMENEKGDNKIGDAYEGSILYTLKQSDKIWIQVLNKNGSPKDKPFSVKPSKSTRLTVGFKEDEKEKLGVASFFYFSLDDMEPTNFESDEEDISAFSLSAENLSLLQSFNEEDERIPIVILDVRKFIKKIENEIDYYGSVTYYDSNNIETACKASSENIVLSSFKKRKEYSNQKEYRLEKWLDIPGKGQAVQLGDLRSIAGPFSIEEISHLAMLIKGLVKLDDQ
ncbi:hypothetical protein [Ligilactobacillus pobuzihii]|uniref:hypothetical protein n=1 Tax=Ligilactobacillus pobuzihii TaxID=449659 RepID=UPI0019D30D21|nr:hypothetical protein [Ligilactobacillus pobuzihii]